MSARRLLIGLGAVLAIMGLIAYVASGFQAKAATAIASGAISGAILAACGVAAGAASRKAKMIGAHLGLLFTLLFGGVFWWRALASAAKAQEQGLAWYQHYAVWIIGIMAILTTIAFVWLLRLRPAPSQRIDADADSATADPA